MKKEIAIEPLVGHVCHPYGGKECVQDGKQVGRSLLASSPFPDCQPCEHVADRLAPYHEVQCSTLNSISVLGLVVTGAMLCRSTVAAA